MIGHYIIYDRYIIYISSINFNPLFNRRYDTHTCMLSIKTWYCTHVNQKVCYHYRNHTLHLQILVKQEKHHVWVQTARLYLHLICIISNKYQNSGIFSKTKRKTRKGSKAYLSTSERCLTLHII